MEHVYKLKHPVPFGENETVTELHMTPHARAFKGFSTPIRADESVIYAPYDLACVAVRMAGKPNAVADRLHPEDMNALALKVMDFLGSGLGTGNTP